MHEQNETLFLDLLPLMREYNIDSDIIFKGHIKLPFHLHSVVKCSSQESSMVQNYPLTTGISLGRITGKRELVKINQLRVKRRERLK